MGGVQKLLGRTGRPEPQRTLFKRVITLHPILDNINLQFLLLLLLGSGS